MGGTLEDRPRYNKTRCFETFPFPDLTEKPDLQQRLRSLGEKLDAHRKARQAEHPTLTLTGMYNVLEKLRKEEPLNDKEKTIHDQGLVTLLKQIHDEIDEAVFEAYGWEDIWQAKQALPDVYDFETGAMAKVELSLNGFQAHMRECEEKIEQEMLQRLVNLNHERAAEEAAGKVRCLRPDFQDPEGTQNQATEQKLNLPEAKAAVATAKVGKPKWPKELPARFAIIQDLVSELESHDPATLDSAFGRASKKRQSEITEVLQTLQSLGQI